MQGPGSAGQPPTVFLHVGAPKTGTTFLQQVLWHNRTALARDGLLYPGERPGAHFHAAQDLRETRFHGYDDPNVPGAWERLAQKAHGWRGHTVVISHEILAGIGEEHARRAVESLQPATVHVVYTARDLVRQIPAVWQESVKNRRVVGLPRYLRALYAPEEPGPWGKIFWGAQDAVDVLRRWSVAVPPEHIHVVTVPPSGGPRGLLWQRFAGLVGLDPARYDTGMGGANLSLGSAEAELLRRVNRAVGQDVDWPTYERLFKHGLAERVLAARTDAERVTLPPKWRPWAYEQSERLVKGLREAGYHVVGDLDELLPPTEYGEGADGESTGAGSRPDADAVLDVAAETIVQLVREQSARAAPLLTGRRVAGFVYPRMRMIFRRLLRQG